MTTLADKIDSLEKYLEVVHPLPAGNFHKIERDFDTGSKLVRPLMYSGQPYSFHLPAVNSNSQFTGFNNPDYWPHELWWLHREHMRLATGVYSTSPTLNNLVAYNPHIVQYALHVSRDNPEQIAWTPTVEDGQRDRQVAMSLGRWLRRVFPGMTDPQVAAIESAHRMFMNPDVEFIDCMTDIDRVIKAYMGVTSCMSKSVSHWGLGHHPLETYAAPGFKLAVIYGAGKKVSGRCIVWINPENENDKRAVRNYGDDSLRQYLKAKGFIFTNLGGAYLKAIPVDSGTKLMVPYVDTAACEVQPNTATAGVHDGDGKIWLFSTETITRIPKDYWVTVQTQNGSTALKTFPLNTTCAASGKPINIMRDTTKVVFVDGKRQQALSSQIAKWPQVHVLVNGRVENLHMPPDTPTFSYSSVAHIDTVEMREFRGYAKLNATLYPDQQEWTNSISDFVRQYDNTWIKSEDAAYLCSATGKRIVHREQLPADAVRVAQIEDRKAFAEPGVEVKTTAANRKVIPGIHDVVEGYNGVWGYRRSMKTIKFWGRDIWVPSAMTMAELAAAVPTIPASVVNDIKRSASKGHDRASLIRHNIFAILNDRGDCFAPIERADNGNYAWTYHFEARDLNVQIIEAAIAAPEKSEAGFQLALAQMKTIIEACDRVLAELAEEAVPA